LMGEGLQHQDGHSLLLASTIPFCQVYDPSFAYELAAIVKNGLNRMYGDAPEDIFYYITLYNENYQMPVRPTSPTIEADIVQGLYKWQAATGGKHQATILFSGSIQGAARAAATELLEKFDVGVDLWSATSYKVLREEAINTERWNRMHPTDAPRQPLVTRLLSASPNPFSPIVAVTDFMRTVPEQVARFIPGRSFTPLGTDGMGRSDTRESLRRHFEIDMSHIVVTVLHQLALAGTIKTDVVKDAIAAYAIDPEAISPLYL